VAQARYAWATRTLLNVLRSPTSTNGTVHSTATTETLLGSLTAPNRFFTVIYT
jgi:hypothetical protein